MKPTTTKIEGMIATQQIIEIYNEVKTLKLQVKTYDKVLEIKTGIIKDYMQGSQYLFDTSGAEIVTYKTGSDREVINIEKLKAEFPEVYAACMEKRPGSRVFLVK